MAVCKSLETMSGMILNQHDSSIKTARTRKEAASSFCPFVPVKSSLVAKVQRLVFGSVGVAGIGYLRDHCLLKAGFEPGSPAARVVDRTTELP